MYMLRVENTVAGGRAAEYEARQAQFFAMLRRQPGYVGSVWLNSLGYPAKYVSLNRWESREALRDANASEAARAFREANPTAGLVTSNRPAEAYEPVLEVVSEGGQANYMALVPWTVNPGQGDAFENGRKEVFELRRRHANGFVSNRLYRFLGNPRQYVVVQGYSTLEALQSAGAPPEIQEWERAHRPSLYTDTPMLGERFAVVQRVQV